MRGEYLLKKFGTLLLPGSPPHAWGILKNPLPTWPLIKDHPHMRGEYLW